MLKHPASFSFDLIWSPAPIPDYQEGVVTLHSIVDVHFRECVVEVSYNLYLVDAPLLDSFELLR